jgi:predicted transglutaminase-like cysteine proteinase
MPITRREFSRYSLLAPALFLLGCTTQPIPFRGKFGLLTQLQGSQADVRPDLEEVLQRVNDKFQYDSDSSTYGESDYWSPASASNGWRGDCEDHALLCRELLQAKGIYGSKLLTCWTETEQYHCVLYMQGWILDVRFTRVMSNTDLQKIGYKWHKAGLEDGRWFYVNLSQ